MEVQTTDCNTIGYLKTATREEAEELTAQLTPRTEYEFKLGMVSRLMSKSPVVVISPSARAIRPLEGDDEALR